MDEGERSGLNTTGNSKNRMADVDAVLCICLVQESLASTVMPGYGLAFTRERWAGFR